MDKKKYMEYLLRNCYRLKDELLQKEECREICLVNYLSKEEKEKLVKDIILTIDFYENLEIIIREIFILRFLKSKLIKEVADITNYSEDNIKRILAKYKEILLEKL